MYKICLQQSRVIIRRQTIDAKIST